MNRNGLSPLSGGLGPLRRLDIKTYTYEKFPHTFIHKIFLERIERESGRKRRKGLERRGLEESRVGRRARSKIEA